MRARVRVYLINFVVEQNEAMVLGVRVRIKVKVEG